MSGSLDLFQSSVGSFYSPLLQHVWSSTIFLAVVLAVAVAARRWLTAKARFALVCVGILKFALPAAPTPALLELFRDGAASRPVSLPPAIDVAGAVLVAPAAAAAGVASWTWLVIAGWLGIAAALFMTRTLAHRRLLAIAERTAVPPRPREVEALERARRRLGIARSIDLVRSAAAEAPAVLRTVRPLVILPLTTSDELSDDELEAVLCHECAHVARFDNLTGRIESLICILFWFQPLLWIAQRMTLLDRERACDEVVAELGETRTAYLDALRTFCRAAIAPRLPGVSCMATAKLKERIDHFMTYNDLKRRAFSTNRVFAVAATALVLFLLLSGFTGSLTALGDSATVKYPYAIQAQGTSAGETSTVRVIVTDNESQQVVAAPTLTMNSAGPASATTTNLGTRTTIDVRPAAGELGVVLVEVSIEKDGAVVYRTPQPLRVHTEPVAAPPRYSGAPLTLSLRDAKLSDVIDLFGALTNLEMRLGEGLGDARVSVEWKDVPWDRALVELLAEHDLTYRIEGSTVLITRK